MSSIGIKKKLLMSHCSIVTVFTVAALIVFMEVRSLVNNKNWTVHTYEVIEVTDNLLLSLVNMETGLRGYMLTGEDHFLEPYNEGGATYQKSIANIKKLTSDNSTQQQLIANLDRTRAEWTDRFVRPHMELRESVNRGLTPLTAIAEAERKERGKQYMDGMREILTQIRKNETTLLTTRFDAMNTSEVRVQLFLLIGIAAAVTVGIVVAISISGSILKALGGEIGDAKRIAEDIAKGNLISEINLQLEDDGSVLRSLKDMRDNLLSLVNSVKNKSNELANKSELLQQSAKEISAATNAQSASTGNMAASLEELSVSISSVSDNAREALASSDDLGSASSQGESIIFDTLSEMEKITKLVTATSDAVENMSVSSEQISNVIDVIREVTEQTNLLALNAAIEAARAGEMGRGFSVVADEVRNLAEKTTQSANEISQMISKVRSSTDSAVTSMRMVVTGVEAGQSLSQDAGTKITAMQKQVSIVSDAISQIAMALQEQSEASNTISQSVENIAQMVDETAASSNASSATATELSQVAKELLGAVEKFKTDRVATG
ncbi:methyl-accepting chemotaxis protein [Teredinibacter turnerae]|uniref:methyl-accepting chemotaxis protein n=1 Tax=Teredinibacter turnerae TaxID=2426 RepID=UPI000367B919|nr:methyl-accepting chemotaxis protein [Teredinibacter turnerae]